MANAPVRFIRRGGRVIPIRKPDAIYSKTGQKIAMGESLGLKAARGVSAAFAGVAIAEGVKRRRAFKKQDVKVNPYWDAASLGLSVASGVLGAATFTSGTKGFISGLAGGFALDAASTAANLASVAGPGKHRSRLKQAARNEARNIIVGNSVYAAGILANPTARATALEYASKAVTLFRKRLGV